MVSSLEVLSLLNNFASCDTMSQPGRLALYRQYGMVAGDVQHIAANLFFTSADLSGITLGDRTYINYFCFLDNGAAIALGDDVFLAPFVKILTSTHENGYSERRVGDTCVHKPVAIGRGTWVCTNATILPGVTIGKGCIIAAGAVVIRDCEPDGLYAGVPAKRVKDLLPSSLLALKEDLIQVEPSCV